MGFSFYNETANTFGIAIVHTIFNIVTTAILLPFNRVLEKLAILTVPDSKDQAGEQHSLLDERLLSTPSVAVGRAMLTGGDMAEICRTSLLQAMSLTHKWDEAIADEVNRKEDAVDHYEDVLGTYLVKLSAKALSREDNRTINTLLHTINDLERISDHSVNLLKAGQEIQEKSIHFSHEAIDDLSVLEAAVQDIVNRTVDVAEYKQGMTYGMMPYKYGKIHLCKNCAIGTGCIVMPGVTVGEGAVVGAGAMVTKDIPAWTLALGCPAKVVKEFPKDDPKYVSKKSQ